MRFVVVRVLLGSYSGLTRVLLGTVCGQVEDGTWQSNGWPSSMYGVSKLGEATYTVGLTRRMPRRKCKQSRANVKTSEHI
eukprot:3328377-Pyramimonas_sp.AAC.1